MGFAILDLRFAIVQTVKFFRIEDWLQARAEKK
jgi:hypothetical protein